MAIMLQDSGALEMLESYFLANDLTIKLFTSNTIPADTDTAGTYTEAAGGGYASKTLATTDCTVAVVSDIATASYPQLVWTFTGALTGNASIYGYYIVDGSGTIIFSERGASAYQPANNGDEYKITVAFQLSKGTPT